VYCKHIENSNLKHIENNNLPIQPHQQLTIDEF